MKQDESSREKGRYVESEINGEQDIFETNMKRVIEKLSAKRWKVERDREVDERDTQTERNRGSEVCPSEPIC